jgi:hypothetical protein
LSGATNLWWICWRGSGLWLRLSIYGPSFVTVCAYHAVIGLNEWPRLSRQSFEMVFIAATNNRERVAAIIVKLIANQRALRGIRCELNPIGCTDPTCVWGTGANLAIAIALYGGGRGGNAKHHNSDDCPSTHFPPPEGKRRNYYRAKSGNVQAKLRKSP